MGEFTETKKLTEQVKLKVLGGAKIPHKVSYPVLRKYDDRYYLAFFVQFYNRETIQKGAVLRPEYWYLADVRTGELMHEFKCKDKDFCSAPFGKLYRRGDIQLPDADAGYVTELFAVMDEIRTHLLEDGIMDAFAYNDYLSRLFAIVPSGQINFYKELSSLK